MFRISEPSRDFSKVCCVSQDRPFLWRSRLGWAHRLGGAGSRGITRVGGQCSPCRWRCRRLQGRGRQRNCGLRQNFRLPQSQAVQFLPVSWVPFGLLPQCWSAEQVSLSMRVRCGPFKRNAWDSRNPRLSVPPSPLVFPGRTCGDLSAPEPWAGRPGLGLGLGPHAPGR